MAEHGARASPPAQPAAAGVIDPGARASPPTQSVTVGAPASDATTSALESLIAPISCYAIEPGEKTRRTLNDCSGRDVLRGPHVPSRERHRKGSPNDRDTLLDHQREERRKSRATYRRARRSAGHFMEIEDTDPDSSFASRSPHHSRSPIDRTRVSDYQAEWSARDPSAQDNDERFGLWTIQGPKRRPRFAKKAEPGAPTEEIPRSKLPSYLITLRPTTRVALASVSQRLLHTTVMAAAPPSELQRHVAIRTNSASNTVTIETYDAQHAKGLLRLTSIRISPNQTIPITAHQTPGKGMCRGVIYRVDPSETAEPLRALYSESRHIIAAQLMGKRGACLETFEETRPPRTIRYWSVLTKVSTYEARSLVFHNCQGLGHKKDIFPHPSTCAKCGRQHSVDVQCMDQTPYCRNCQQSGHLGTDTECPTRRRFEERSKEREKDRRSRSRNRRRSRCRSSS
ncbi:hypothetical protein HPB48_014380 [Haemaphysalis longicornis]|uniref:Uncharacterized protein n=1 Tax=Haemaphysalis longicornis TaxID=44386 RepID=A0A9J6GE08_HAELO|nr:hypothetical protein HPB48_014380 [Haemaphysalis longicornis]